jgi:hypothetical protein
MLWAETQYDSVSEQSKSGKPHKNRTDYPLHSLKKSSYTGRNKEMKIIQLKKDDFQVQDGG